MGSIHSYPYDPNLIEDLSVNNYENNHTRKKLTCGLLKIVSSFENGGIVLNTGMSPNELFIVHNDLNSKVYEVCFTNFEGMTLEDPPILIDNLRLFIDYFLHLFLFPFENTIPILNSIEEYIQYYQLNNFPSDLDRVTVLPTSYSQTIRIHIFPLPAEPQWESMGTGLGYLHFNSSHIPTISALIRKYLIFQRYLLIRLFPKLVAFTPHYLITYRDPLAEQVDLNLRIFYIASEPEKIRMFLFQLLNLLSLLFSNRCVLESVTIERLLWMTNINDVDVCIKNMQEVVPITNEEEFLEGKRINLIQLSQELNGLIEVHEEYEPLPHEFQSFQLALSKYPNLPPSFFLLHPLFLQNENITLSLNLFLEKLQRENSSAIVNRLRQMDATDPDPDPVQYQFAISHELQRQPFPNERLFIQSNLADIERCYELFRSLLGAVRCMRRKGIVHGHLRLETVYYVASDGSVVQAIHGFENAIDFGNTRTLRDSLVDIRAIGRIFRSILKLLPHRVELLSDLTNSLLNASDDAIVDEVFNSLL